MTKVTIIIPLFDRHEHTDRILGYYNLNKVDYTFFLADSSKKKKFNQKYFDKKFPFIKIFYKSFPTDKNGNSYAKKMLNISKKVKSEYVYQCANDDFFNPLFIKKAEKFLDKNKSYSFVGGIVRNVKIVQLFKPVNDFGIIRFQEKNQYYNYKGIYRNINHANYEKRIIFCLSSLPFEAVLKKNTYNEVWKLINEFKINNFHEIDWFLNIIPLVHGKKKLLNIISTIRQSNTFSGLGLSNVTNEAATTKRFDQFLEFLFRKKIIKTKILFNQLKNSRFYKISVEGNQKKENKKILLKKKYFIAYLNIKNFIFKINYIITFFIFLLYKNKYDSLYNKIYRVFKQ
jgi:glycosyltransferase domain-containing protein